ncbi:monocarboxylate transporter 12-B-like [Pholidichthys leucotaenia]
MAVTEKERLDERRGVPQVPTPPEGGWGWMIVASCFLATICIRAVTRCVSMFFVEFQMHFAKDYATTAWIHSLIDCTTMLCAPLGSFLGNRLSCRATIILGGLLSSTGLVLSSFASSLEFLYISLGILTGVGFALSYTPAIAMVGKYFKERNSLAYGIALSGSGIGTFLLAPVVQQLIEHFSWRGALLILGGLVSNLCVCGALMRPVEPRQGQNVTVPQCTKHDWMSLMWKNLTNLHKTLTSTSSNTFAENYNREKMLEEIKFTDPRLYSVIERLKLVTSLRSNMLSDMDAKIKDLYLCEAGPKDEKTFSLPPQRLAKMKTCFSKHCFRLKAWKEFGFLTMPGFLILSMSLLFMAYGCSAPVVYLVPYALSIGVQQQHAAYLMSIFGISGIVGNITFGWITDKKCLRRYRMLSYMVAVAMEGLCCMFLPFLHSFPLMVPFSLLYGYFDGAYVALIPVVTSDTVGSTYLTSALGVVYFLHAIPYLASPPIGGWLVDWTGNYAATFFLCSASFILSSVILLAAMLFRRCRRCKSSTDAAANQDIL